MGLGAAGALSRLSVERTITVHRELLRVEGALRTLEVLLEQHGRLTTTVRHDFSNVMMVIVSFRQLLEAPSASDLVDEAEAGIARAVELMRRIGRPV